MANKVEILVTATDKASAVLNKATGGVKGLSSAFQGVTGISLGTAGAISAVAAAVQQSVKFTMDYANQVETLSRNIGATTEEASRLIQVSDDVKLSVGDLETGLKSAITKGYEPTIDGMMKMANQYTAIQDPIARSKFLVDTFGRSGLEMGKLMELGADGIKKLGKEAKMILSAGDLARMNDYYKATDSLNDSVNQLKVSFGLMSAGPLAWLADKLASGIDLWGSLNDQIHEVANAVGEFDVPLKKLILVLNPLQSPIENIGEALGIIKDDAPEVADGIKQIGDAGKKTGDTIKTNTLPNFMALADAIADNVPTVKTYAQTIYALSGYISGLRDKSFTITQYMRYVTLSGNNPQILSGAGGGGSRMGVAFANAFGGSYRIPAAFGFEGANVGPGLTASGGERVTVTPEGQNQELDLSMKTIKRLALAMRDIGLTSV